MKLEDWRKEIDLIDTEIVKLIGQRARVVRKIGNLKAKTGFKIVDRDREAEILDRACRNSGGDLDDSSILRIYERILYESRQIQVGSARKIDRSEAGIY